MRYERNEESALLFKELRAYPVLKKEEELELAVKAQAGCKRSVQKLVAHNMLFAIKEANRFLGMGLHFNDLVQEASIGLMTAAEKFTPDRDCKFITYARMWIRKALNEALVEHGTIVKLPM